MVNCKKFSRRNFLKWSAMGMLTLNMLSLRKIHAARGKRRKPNIIFILADDLGYGDLGCYGQKQIKTPNLDRMAAEGMRFTQHYAGSTVCAPSRATLMLGQHTGHLRTSGQRQTLKNEDTTVAEVLKEADYTTSLIGKWHLGNAGSTGIPNKQGFDYFYGYLNAVHAHNYYPEYLWRNQKKVKLENVVIRPKKHYDTKHAGAAIKREEYSNDLFTEQALDFIERSKEKSFFLYLAYTIPHANNEWKKALVQNDIDPSKFLGHGMEVPDYGIYKDKNWPEVQRGYAAMITRLDSYIGSILEKLKQHGIDEHTIVFFSSDNGPHHEGGNDPDFFNSNGPLRGIKRDLYEGGIRVPMIARWPGKIKKGTVSNHISGFWDFLPTCAELVEVETQEEIDGISILPTLLGKPEKQKKHEYLYWKFPGQGGKKAVRMGDWKAVRLNVKENPDGTIELYNLKSDIGEKHNLADKHPEIVSKIERYLKM